MNRPASTHRAIPMPTVHRLARVATMLALAVGLAGEADAAFFINYGGVTSSTADTTTFRYVISFTPGEGAATPDSVLKSGDFVTIYDFSNVLTSVSMVAAPSGFVAFIAPTGLTPTGYTASDDASINNLTFRYNGPNFSGSTTFSAFVTLAGTYTRASRSSSYASQVSNVNGSTNIRDGGAFVPELMSAPVPEPSSLVLCGVAGLGALGVAGARRRAA